MWINNYPLFLNEKLRKKNLDVGKKNFVREIRKETNVENIV